METRQSRLKQFGECAYQYYLQNVLELGEDQTGSLTALGSVWHFSAEVYERYGHNLELGIRTFEHYWKNPGRIGVNIDFWHKRTDHESLRKRGIMMLEKYHETAPWREGKLLGTEIWFKVPLGDHVLTGTIDKLFYSPGKKQIDVWDFKTGSYVPERLRYNIQFTAYAYATLRPEFWQRVPGFEDGFERFAGWKRYGWWYHARNAKLLHAGYRDEKDYKRLLLAANQMAKAIELGVYPLDVEGKACGYCQFVDGICGQDTPNPVELTSIKGWNNAI